MNDKPLDFNAYTEMKDVMEEVLPELLNTFVEYMPEQLNDLNKAIEDNNPDLLFGIAHRMKSSCNSLGALGLAKIAESIEMIGRGGSIEGASEITPQFAEQLDEVISFFKQELKELG
ncbi:MAG: Hpt domain-containing protein [Gammaproteobacteria bacterium]|nr:Hpt domain-containing protein [Gammaproteobacteria bacterium]MCW8924424.1 Hpt domain-containing protein [Gammaproteobacteria bacterium]